MNCISYRYRYCISSRRDIMHKHKFNKLICETFKFNIFINNIKRGNEIAYINSLNMCSIKNTYQKIDNLNKNKYYYTKELALTINNTGVNYFE